MSDTDYRSHPEYADGYEDSWYGDGVRNHSEPYLAGYRAAQHARSLFESAGFTRGPGGFYTRTETIKGGS